MSPEKNVELISVEGAALTRLFQAKRTRGAISPVALLNGLIDRYKFVSFPTVEEAFADKAIFNHGAFQDTAIDALEIYNDGVVIRARAHTNVLEEFFDDIDNWMIAEFGMMRSETHSVATNIESRLLIKADPKILGTLDKLKKLGEAVSSRLRATNGQTASFESFGFTLAPDTSKMTGMLPSPFRIERRLGLSFDLHYFISMAPLRTDDHMAVLHQLEAM